MSLEFTCSCRTWKRRTIPPEAVAAYCAACLGWLKRPVKAGTASERQRIEVLKPTEEAGAPAAKIHRGGRPKLKEGCSKGHASWAWVKDKQERRRCKLCERERKARSRRGAA